MEHLTAALERAGGLLDAGQPEEAMIACNELLNDYPDDWRVLYLMGSILIQAERFGLALTCYRAANAKAQHVADTWNAMGRVHQEQTRYDEAEKCFREALKRNPNYYHAYCNLGLIAVQQSEPDKALKLLDKALELEPSCKAAYDNKSMALLMKRQWAEGWKCYTASIGSKYRRERQYGVEDEGRWEGPKSEGGWGVVVTGEQGIGDEVMFASCIPDAIRDCERVIIETERRLVGLFQRSFPGATVYGTRYEPVVDWADVEQYDRRVMMGTLPLFYRRKEEDFPGVQYLKACPRRRIMARALMDSIHGSKRLKIGIAWSGGSVQTGSARRSIDGDLVAQLAAEFPACDFVSLQYKGGTVDGVHDFQFLTRSNDYDDTAALVAECDLVITVTTAVMHLAGALGVRTVCLVPEKPTWRYHLSGQMPWYKSVKLLRQEGSKWPIDAVRALLSARNIVELKETFTKLMTATE